MKTIIRYAAPSLAALSGLALAMPAQAHDSQSGRNDHSSRYEANHRYAPSSIRSDIAQLKRDINRAEQRRFISHREAMRLDSQVRRLERNYAVSARNGLSRAELASLQRQVRSVQFSLRAEMNDHNGRRG